MGSGAATAPGRRLAATLLLLAAAAFAYGLLEYIWQAHVSPPPEPLPGGAGASWPMMTALAWMVVVLPGALALLVTWPLPTALRCTSTLFAGFWPTAIVALDRLSRSHAWQWTGIEQGGVPHILRVLLVAGAGVAVLAVPLAIWVVPLLAKAVRPAAIFRVCLGLCLLSPVVFWTSRHRAEFGEPTVAAPPAGQPNVLILTIDTLRQDALGAYGGPPAANLDSLLATGTCFDGWSVSSWTRPSMASLFAGIAPTGTGVDVDHAMRPDLRTWVQSLQDAGYWTGAIASNPHLRARFGFDRGFENFEHSDQVEWLAPVIRSFWGTWLQHQLVDRRDSDRGDRMVGRARDWLRHPRSANRPWLLWVHLMDPHLPYHLRGEHGERVPRKIPDWVQDLGSSFEDGRFRDLPGAREGRCVTTAAARRALRRLYQREVLFADREAGRLLRWARDASPDRELLWVFAADHGEEFWDDGGFEHGHSLHQSVLRVPLAMGGIPAIPAGVHAGPLRLSDVGPTLLDLLHIRGFDPSVGAELEDLAPELRARVLGHDRSDAFVAADSTACRWPALMAEGMFYGPPQTRLLSAGGRDILVHDDSGEVQVHERCRAVGGDAAPALTDSERSWLVQLDRWRETLAPRSLRVEDDPELDRRLRSLGYLK